MSGAYYNEFEPYAAEWLRNLIKKGLIADGEVDSRSIVDVRPEDLRGFTQCHFFAGIGVWSYALRLAGWPDDRPVWTGSCPCQPFSAAGKGKGFEDERHLWPVFHRLIAECRPPVVFGEQVASKDGLAWLDTVFADLEGSGYAAGAVDCCAAGVGAPHIRQRLWFVGERLGYAYRAGSQQGKQGSEVTRHGDTAFAGGGAGGLGDHHHHTGLEGQRSGHQAEGGWLGAPGPAAPAGEPRGMADADGRDASAEGLQRGWQHGQQPEDGGAGRLADSLGDGRGALGYGHNSGDDGREPDAGRCDDRPCPTNGHWGAADWLHCRDGKWRPVEPGTFPLAHGAPSRVGRLRAYGNAIVPQVAAEVIGAFMDTKQEAAE